MALPRALTWGTQQQVRAPRTKIWMPLGRFDAVLFSKGTRHNVRAPRNEAIRERPRVDSWRSDRVGRRWPINEAQQKTITNTRMIDEQSCKNGIVVMCVERWDSALR